MDLKIEDIALSRVHSHWYENILTQWHPDSHYIDYLTTRIKSGQYIPPILTVRENDRYVIVNGHHRVYAHLAAGWTHIKAVVIDGSFEDTEPLRKAEVLLKIYDQKTNYKYHFSEYLDRWIQAQQYETMEPYRPPRKSSSNTFFQRALASIQKRIAGIFS
jgi:hypothetical protein